MKLFDILKKHCGSLHKNKFVKGDKVIWHDAICVVVEFVNQRDTTKYIIMNGLMKLNLKKFGRFKIIY